MYSLVLLTVLAQPVPEPPQPSASPPEQMLATIDSKGKLTLVHVTCACYGPATQEHTVTAQETKGDGKVEVKAKVKTSTVMVITTELLAKHVEAFTADGRPIAPEKLPTLLAKERAVLVATDGKKVDPFLLQLYKDDVIVLVPPANTINMGYGNYGGVAPVPVPVTPVPEVVPPPRPPQPEELKKPERRP